MTRHIHVLHVDDDAGFRSLTGLRHRAVHKDGSTVHFEARPSNLVADPDVEAILIYSRPDSTTTDG